MSISSLSGRYGIGSLGKVAKDFANFLCLAGVKIWQILPINPTSYGDSPYQSFSSVAGNIYFIDLECLVEEDIMRECDLPCEYDNERVNYGELYIERYETLKRAYKYSYNKVKNKVEKFSKSNIWVEDYSLFMALKEENDGKSWQEWDELLKHRDKNAIMQAKLRLKKQIEFYKFTQYLFFKQYFDLKKYVNSLGIKIMGDMPIYVSLDSCDVWCNPNYFKLDDNLKPVEVAGVPPDYFSEEGQLWGNPIINWDNLEKNKFDWWVERVEKATEVYDIIRLDHFIGYAKYYSIPAESKTAKNGKWNKGVGKTLFDAIYEKVPNANFIAEDLGDLTVDVINLREELNFIGMKVLQFCFDYNSNYAINLNEVDENSLFYTGTHDNDTLLGWWESLKKEHQEFIKEKLQIEENENAVNKLLELSINCGANYVIVPIQDLYNLGTNCRMNTPGTVGGNWQFRLNDSYLTEKNAQRIKEIIKKVNR